MSSLLRSYKILKHFSSVSKSVVLPKKSVQVVPVQTSSFLNFYYRDYANAATQADSKVNSIEKWVRRLDYDVRRSGRINFRELQEVLAELKLSPVHATSTQSLMVIRCCGSLVPEEVSDVKTQLVSDIWATLEKQGVPLDISHYNTLLMVYLENEHKFSPTEFLAMLEKKGVEPNRVTFQRLITAYCQQGNIGGATRILEFMKEKQMPISENIFNSLIIGHSQTNDMESAKGILGVMQQANIQPSSDTYTALLCGHAKYGDIDGITEIFTLAESKEVAFQDKQLLEVIYNLSVNGHSKLMDIVLPRLSRQSGYNQDAKNTILRLISSGQDEAAIKLFKTMTPVFVSEDEPLPGGTFLLKQMVKMNRPIETIISLCEELKDSKNNERALFYATESCLLHGKTEMGLKLISALTQIEPVCQHYYWPALRQYGKRGDQEGIIRTLKQMSVDMNQPIPNETLREYVVEHMGPNEKGIYSLRQAGITVASAASAVVAYHLNNLDLASAAKTALKYRANYNLAVIRRGIVQAHKMKPDVDNLIVMVRSVVSSQNSVESNNESEEPKELQDPAGSILIGISSAMRQDRDKHLTQILQGYLEYGLGISNATAKLLQDRLSGSDLTPEISDLLAKLTSSDLSFVSVERERPTGKRNINFDKDESTIIELINRAEAKEESTDSLTFQLIALYCKQQEYEKGSKIRQELSDKGVEIPPDYLVELLKICVNNENFSEADKYYQEIRKITPNSTISDSYLVKLASLYLAEDKFDDVLNIFENHKKETYEEMEFSYTSNCWKMLNSLAEKGDHAKVEKLFHTLKSCNYIMPTNVLLGPLVRVHLVKDDIKTALDKFEECCTLYRSTPWKNEIACKLIQSEDASSLQRLTDLSTQIHGEVNSLYDLVLSFIECGRVRQARKILETPGLRTRHSRLNSACLRYLNEGRVNHLENLVEVTKDLPHIDRAEIYYHLLSSYFNSDDVDKALGLWTQMQEEDVQPTDRFLIKLATLLKKHSRAVPYSIPTSATTDRLHTIQKDTRETGQIKALRKAIYNKDLDKALQIKQSLLDTELHASDRSTLLTLLINNGRIGESTKLLTQWLEIGLRPNIRTLNYLINTVAKTGDVDSLSVIGNMLDDDLKRLTSFTNRYTHCMVEAGKVEDVFKQLDKEITEADSEEKVDKCRRTFPRGGMFSVLSKHPDYIPKCEKLAMKYKEKGILEPLNILWISYFNNKDQAKIDEVWPLLKDLDRLMYQPILKLSRSERDLPLVENLLKYCKETNVNSNALGAIHSCIFDVLIMLDRIDDCSARLDETLKTVPIDYINFTTLKRIKKSFEDGGKLFKYTIPPKKTRSLVNTSSSDSDSDDEVRQKA